MEGRALAGSSVASRTLRLADHRQSPHAYGRRGDWVLAVDGGTQITVSSLPDGSGHRPLRGALIDVATGPSDRQDPLLWWRAGWVDASGRGHWLVASEVGEQLCSPTRPGLFAGGSVDGVSIRVSYCAESASTFLLSVHSSELPPGASLGEELHPGTADSITENRGADWEGSDTSSFVAFASADVGVAWQGEPFGATRKQIHIAAESFPTALLLRSLVPGSRSLVRRLYVNDGNLRPLLAQAAPSPRHLRVHSTFASGDGGGGWAVVVDAAGKELAKLALTSGMTELRLPRGLGTRVRWQDAQGTFLGDLLTLDFDEKSVEVDFTRVQAGSVVLRYRDERGAPLPVHVLFRGKGGTGDPSPLSGPRAYAAGRSLYLLDGDAKVTLPQGDYLLTASHGMTHTLSEKQVHIEQGTSQTVEDTLRPAIDTRGFVSADLHLHSVPSPDSSVSLEERVASLACEGVSVAVATDHNRITDLSGTVRAFSLRSPLLTAPGVEVTSSGSRLWGHFNAFPLPVPKGAPEDVTPPYFDRVPCDLLGGARKLGAKVIQVNHGRMDPNIGYFDLVHLDPKTGHVDDTFSANFDAVEVFNGVWLEMPENTRAAALDLFALARRGLRVAATGNSDSHRLLYEEAGYPRTFVHVASGSPSFPDVVQGLLRHETTVSSGPFVEMTVQGEPIGSIVSAKGRHTVRAHVRVSAPDWVSVERVELLQDGAAVQSYVLTGPPSNGVRFERDIEVTVRADSALMAWADSTVPLPDVVPYSKAMPLGFTGLTFIDAEDDGEINLPPP